MPNLAYLFETFAAGVEAVVMINGWPALETHANEKPQLCGSKVNAFLVEGQNPIEVRLRRLKDTIAPMFRFKLATAEHDADSEDRLLLYQWTPEEHPLDDEEPVVVFRHVLRMGRAFGPWSWQSSRPFTSQDRPEIERLVKSFNHALARKDKEGAIDMSRTKLDDLARALGVPQDYVLDHQRNYLSYFMDAPDWEMADVEPEEMEFHPRSGGRLVTVTGPRRTPLLIGLGNQSPFVLDLTVSHVEGAYRIVR